MVARVEEGEKVPLSKLVKHLKISERRLTRMKRMDVYNVAILRRDFPDALP